MPKDCYSNPGAGASGEGAGGAGGQNERGKPGGASELVDEAVDPCIRTDETLAFCWLSQEGLLAMCFIPGCTGRGSRSGSENFSGRVCGSVFGQSEPREVEGRNPD